MLHVPGKQKTLGEGGWVMPYEIGVIEEAKCPDQGKGWA
jgi:hypothetical protein